MWRFVQTHKLIFAFAILWIVGVSLAAAHWQHKQAASASEATYQTCMWTAPNGDKVAEAACETKKANIYQEELNGLIVGCAVIAAGSLALVLPTILLLIQISKFLVELVKSRFIWREFSTYQKAKTVFFLVWSVGIGIFIYFAISILLYKANSPPEVVGDYYISDASSGFLTAEGALVREDDNDIGVDKSHTITLAKFVCERATMTCTEAYSEISKFTGDWSVEVDQTSFEISSWDTNQIVFGSQAMCGETNYTIDLIGKSLSGYWRAVNQDQKYCSTGPRDKVTLERYRLEKPFDRYWEEMQRARHFLPR